MATVTIDSELMTNYVSTVPIPSGSHHVTVLDENRMPMVFCLSNDISAPRLQILRRDTQGHSQLFDVHQLIGLPENAHVQTFHVEQSWELKLYLAVAYEEIGDNTKSLLHLVRPFNPERLRPDGEALTVITGNTRFGAIFKILMAPISGTNPNTKFPDIFLIHNELDQTSSWGKDISHIHVQAKFKGWFATQQLDTPEPAAEILDIAPASSVYGQGLYVLYVVKGITKIYARYLRPDPNATDGAMYTFTTNVSCPNGARCIASILNSSNGHSCLLIAAPDGIRYLTTIEATEKDKPGKLIFTESMFKSIRQLEVSQDNNDVSIWFRNNKDELGYIRTKATSVQSSAVSSLLLPAGMSSAFSAVITAPHAQTGNVVRQAVVSNDRSGNLMLIEQSLDVGLWRKTPFYKPSPSEPTPLKSYTITIKAKDNQGNNLSNGSLRLSASSSISILLNGRNTLLTTIPTWLDCDQSGSLDFIIPTESLGSQKLVIDQARSESGEALLLSREEYDASSKPMKLLSQKLQEIKSVGQFQSLKTQSGGDLFDGDVKQNQDLMKGAHSCLQTVTAAYGNMQSQSSTTISTTSATTNLVVKAQSSSDSFGDALMDGFFWLKEKFEEVTEWFIETAGTIWKFVCKIAGEIKEFVLDCVEKICEAATWIWEKVKVGWEKLVDFIGFIFSWDDILTTKDTISSTITAGLGYAAIKMDDISAKVDGFFTDLEKTVEQFGESIKLDKKLGGDNDPKDKKVAEAQSSTSTTWASERLKNGGAGTNTTVDYKGDKKTDNEATTFWESSVVPEINKLEASMSKVGQDITALFHKDGAIDGQDIIKVSKSLLIAGIQAVKGIIIKILQLVKTLFAKISDLGNAAINIPIFTWLYKKITKGHTLTLFDAISLVIAIPTTIFAKLITGKAPPTFDKMDGNLMKSLIEGGDVDQNIINDWSIFRAEVVVGITLTSAAVGLIKLFYKMATQGLDGALDELKTGPSSFFDIFGIVVDMIGCLMAIPDQLDMPGAEYRNAISGISCFRGVYHTVAFFIPSKAAFEKVVLVFDLLTVLANLGLSIAVGIEEAKAGSSWKDYDEGANATGFITSGLNALAGIAYFTAFFFKQNPEISAVGAAVMTGTMAGGAVLQGIVFKLQYDSTKRAALNSPPPF
ncbi:uncharacterized protein FIESC28_04224 [Fusarium coffeatum]|uniref:Uncharacterized protein n=1 Tax=Fusarium coffeatum TaxID=231269 RepID=A0A366S2G3_9HYPO|nr:uncharacterized protein FIESC28_04224 [Fusarium coffeatum]RBR22926.1 hypothetical protein FIESC28_04224 [Fusarium coffeatum]